jgi:rod shape-determining protein MreC
VALPARGRRSRTIVALLVATAVTLITLDFRGFGPLESAQRAVRGALEPIAGLATGATRPVTRLWNGIADYGRLEAENKELRAEVDRLRATEVDEANARQQLDAILAQQGIETPAGIGKVLARVVAGPPSNFENTIRIDKGADDGIAANMTVVTDAGLVGRVAEVFDTRSVVELADTRGFGVGVRLVGGPAQTTFLARGQGPGSNLVLQGEIDPATGIEDGAGLVTSGLDASLFPPDILVGRVTGTGLGPAAGGPPPTVAGGEGRPLRGVEVKLFVDPTSLSYVTVLQTEPQR